MSAPADCASPIRYTFERWGGVTGVMAGGFDDPNWFGWTAETAKHIFLASARPETVIPTDLPTFVQHATTADGAPLEPLTLGQPTAVRDLRLDTGG